MFNLILRLRVVTLLVCCACSAALADSVDTWIDQEFTPFHLIP